KIASSGNESKQLFQAACMGTGIHEQDIGTSQCQPLDPMQKSSRECFRSEQPTILANRVVGRQEHIPGDRDSSQSCDWCDNENIEKARVANELHIGLGSAPQAPDESRIGAEPADQQSEPGSQATNLRLVLDAFPDKGMDLLEIHAGSQDALTQNAITRFAGVVGAPEKNA